MAEDLRPAFEEAIKENRYDAVTRKVFADWLEENGFDDEAVEQRRCATGEWAEADKWMRDFGERVGQTYRHLIDAGHEQFHMPPFGETEDDFQNAIQNDSMDRELYWQHWHTITGVPVEEDSERWMSFSCSC